ncbi:MAG TPA: hypothetical protein VGL72_31245, partial [Bryobacteraceae bacterium]
MDAERAELAERKETSRNKKGIVSERSLQHQCNKRGPGLERANAAQSDDGTKWRSKIPDLRRT